MSLKSKIITDSHQTLMSWFTEPGPRSRGLASWEFTAALGSLSKREPLCRYNTSLLSLRGFVHAGEKSSLVLFIKNKSLEDP